jgi:ribokinase
MHDVVVFGSLNVDLVFKTERLPSPGETVMGEDLVRFAGGKGANQAVAAARMGARTAMIGAVGDDADGEWLLESLRGDGVDVSGIVKMDAPTGTAAIVVDEEGRNQIVVSPGANRLALLPASIVAKVVLAQNEVPFEGVKTFFSRSEARFRIWNPAPAMPILRINDLNANVIVPNELEAGLLFGSLGMTPERAAFGLVDDGYEHVIVTLGERGVLYPSVDGMRTIPAPRVNVVDTTAAGDVFCGALAAFLSEGMTMEASIEDAIRAASLSVTRPGAQASIPYRHELI